MESLLSTAASYIALAIQAVAIVIVVAGSARALANIIRAALGPHVDDFEVRAVWLEYARWLVAALTFQLAADIVATSFSPTWDDLGRLAVVALVRTFLSYFLDREIEQRARLQAVQPSVTQPLRREAPSRRNP
jgi:uncharacterized membrane protein